MLPSPTGPVAALQANGRAVDLFELVDRLEKRYSGLYVADLEGIDHGDPQLDYLQEIGRDLELWVDAGIRTGEQVIDILVNGARYAILSTSHLAKFEEVEAAWRLSPEIAVEVDWRDAHLDVRGKDWPEGVEGIAHAVRGIGVSRFIVSHHGDPIDWSVVRQLAAGGPVWVGGSFESSDRSQLQGSGATGAFFHLNEMLAEPDGDR
ncbi:MAG: HisA/HisF-related TIM barrel protein [Thermoplasmata archaeon]|nr:HisA/HisF-related TIM barrel protein [Thermoplasmata archaeon]